MLVLNIYFKDFLNLVLTDSLNMSLLKTLVVKGFDTTSEKFKQSNKRVCTDEERILFNLKIPFYIYMLLWQFCVQFLPNFSTIQISEDCRKVISLFISLLS